MLLATIIIKCDWIKNKTDRAETIPLPGSSFTTTIYVDKNIAIFDRNIARYPISACNMLNPFLLGDVGEGRKYARKGWINDNITEIKPNDDTKMEEIFVGDRMATAMFYVSRGLFQ